MLAFIHGLATAIEVPARQSMMIQLVGRDDLQAGIALNSSAFNLARFIGPAIGGLVIHRFGIAWCFGLNALSFLAVIWGLMLIQLPVVPSTLVGTRLRAILSGATRDAEGCAPIDARMLLADACGDLGGWEARAQDQVTILIHDRRA